MSSFAYRTTSLCGCSLSVLLSCAAHAAIEIDPHVATFGKDTAVALHLDRQQAVRDITLSPGGPELVRQIALPSASRTMAQSGQFLLIGSNDGVHVFDIANDTLISQIKHEGGFKNILAGDSFAIALDAHDTLFLFDLSTPAQPRISARLQMEQPITAFGQSNDQFFAVRSDHTLLQLMINGRDSLSAEPLNVSSSTINAVSGDGNYLYIADDSGLLVGKIENGAVRALGRYHCNNPATAVAVSHQLALISCNGEGVTVVDVSDPTHPQWRGSHQQLGKVAHIFAGEGHPVVMTGDTLLRLSLDNPAEPSILNSWRSRAPLQDAINQNDKVYALTENTISLVDFSHTQPQLSNQALNFGQGVNLGGERRVFISGHLAYVADWFSGIHIYDIQNPRSPRLLSSFHTPGSPKGIIVRDNIAYVADDDHGLEVIDVRDPNKPKQIASLLTSGLAYTPKLAGDMLFLASHRGGFQIIDVSKPSAPRLITDHDTPGKAWSLEVHDNRLYVADDDTGLLIFDISDTAHPTLIGQFSPGTAAEEVVIRDNVAFVAFFNDGLYILDIKDPTRPAVLSHLALPGNSRGLDIIGDRAYVAGWLAGIQIVDISQPEQPRLLGAFDTPGASWGIKVVCDNAYVMDWWGGFLVVDITDPQRLRSIGSYHRRGQVLNTTTRGNYLFAADGSNGLQVFDIKNPLNPTWITGAEFPGTAYDVLLSHDEALVAAGTGGIVRIDIRDPFNIRVQETLRGLVDTRKLAVRDNVVFALDQDHTLLALDRSHPGPIQVLDRLDLAATDFLVLGNQLLLNGAKGMALVNFNSATGFGAITALDSDYRPQHLINTGRDRSFIAAIGQLIVLYTIDGDHLISVKQLDFGSRIQALTYAEGKMYVAGDNEFAIYRLDQSELTKLASYPLLTAVQNIQPNNDTAYLSGGETPIAIRLLPPLLPLKSDPTAVTVSVPGSFPTGSYQVHVHFDDTSTVTLDNGLDVAMPSFGKPKMTLDQFKKLLEQKKNTDLFVHPPKP